MCDYQQLLQCRDYLNGVTSGYEPEFAVVLGSGLGTAVSDIIKVDYTVSYQDIPDFPVSTVRGHSGRFLFGRIGGVQCAVMQGRVHYYEGYSSAQAVMPIRVLGLMGAKTLLVTNASGGIRRDLVPATLMLITDYILYNVPSPLIGANITELGLRFPDMTGVFAPRLQEAARHAALKAGVSLKEGVYLQCSGPQFESPAEIRAYERLGADAVGMSTAIEAIAARHMGMEVVGISCISNAAAGITGEALSSDDVDITAASAAENLAGVIEKLVTDIGHGG